MQQLKGAQIAWRLMSEDADFKLAAAMVRTCDNIAAAAKTAGKYNRRLPAPKMDGR